MFDTVIVVDWSGGNDRGATPKADAIWVCVTRGGVADAPVYLRNRQVAEDWIGDTVRAERAAGRRVMVGFDFPFGYPQGFARAVAGTDDPLELWDWFAERIEDAPKANNRFDVAGVINLSLGGKGPFWGNGLKRDIDGLARTKAGYENPFAERRRAEVLAKGAFSVWQLSGAGSVGSQALMGLPVLARLRRRFGDDLAVWPFQTLDAGIALVEVWPSLIAPEIAARAQPDEIKDAAQVWVLSQALSALAPDRLAAMLVEGDTEEGWILGLGHEDSLRAALRPDGPLPPPLSNDCFALPPGVNWTPVDEALTLLQERLTPVAQVETVAVQQALGRVLAASVTAQRSNPPRPNTAVDGYGFAGGRDAGVHVLPLVAGRAAAGGDFDGAVPAGHAVRVLTGAALPAGVDTVVLQEDVTVDGDRIAFNGPVKAGANSRRAGEDVAAGDEVLSQGRRLTPADLALLAAVGVGAVPVFAPLRVGVLSTGDELAEAGTDAGETQIYDANRPMLLGLLARLGHVAVDLGRVRDDRAALAAALDGAQVDAILTSGGASAGDEDHVSALLREAGALALWRIAVKPGRPLALGMWKGTPVFGLPGNPVAAMVCTLVFAAPALALLAGSGWQEPQGFTVPAGFEKSKKPGRREYLRARMREGVVEVFRSEGSGRISGLSWAEGLVELPDGPLVVKRGDPVRFIPWGGFGL
ncbi:molybdopterin molybdenumtransferase MoeA [Sulfitobacter pseudonitzschiae]|uniref:Molybdopterin molybdenumtransferase n=1 Tax=Pseudosulfitobacter pseudonitzschiae TaxID=1402135 RepID=A0A9Q2RWY3_9RHOB|nr:molybdopterin-binding protein [Pseudosulfitobacter pseudonitzschiae]MBM2291905.1 molybdopterin molybdenumtransferase MoeA [Pseudosulfitobacter pseudonitzschiae]MBM2296823.1 molybdopterin molybdenumtransferase MoeA [Pseudosulfitobacter pseudonitzschiae]MBM2301736.1 molybdopterin molybdenumtransferase MoeA [Pseudosulfitobacter pseudonitzschiae]MBM2311519.1 molybdopterin molybdenumtransferase MoeA [Pseudosulfitobacter pseudonitzschiae]MBM2316433.1 molybdopterin molybdenumtransferase MoeA [Pseu